MKNLLTILTVLFTCYASPANAQIIKGSFEGTELACLSSTTTYNFGWSNPDEIDGAKITYSVKDRAGEAIDSRDLTSSTNDGVLTLVIDKNHFDIIIKMTVKVGTTTKSFTKRLQVGLGDALNIDMITASPTTIRCRDNRSEIILEVDKMNVYGVDFLWVLPIGWEKIVGGNDNYIKVLPDGIHTGSITCQMKVYGDSFVRVMKLKITSGILYPLTISIYSLQQLVEDSQQTKM